MFKFLSRESSPRNDLTQLQTELFADHFGQLLFSTVEDGAYVPESVIDFCDSSANARRLMAQEEARHADSHVDALL